MLAVRGRPRPWYTDASLLVDWLHLQLGGLPCICGAGGETSPGLTREVLGVRRICVSSMLAVCIVLSGCRPANPSTPTPDTPPATTATARATAAASTSPARSRSTQSPTRGTVTVWLDWTPSEMEGLTRVIEAFHGLNPDVEFVVSYFPTQDLRSAFEAAVARGTGPSILFGPDVWGPVLWQEGRVQDVADLLAPGVRAAILPLALAQVTYGEVVLGVPIETQGVVLYVNRDLLPEPADTVTELLVPGRGSDGRATRGSADLGLNFAGSQLVACDATLITPGGEPAFAGAPGLCWLDLLRTIGRGSEPTYNTDDDLSLFETGQVSWIMDGTWNMERLLGSVGGETLAIDPWPVYETTSIRLAGYVWTENAYLAADLATEDLEASWEFIRYLISPEVQSILAEPGGARHLPAAAGVWVSDPLLSQAMAALSQGAPFPINPEMAVYAEPAERAIWLVVRQGASPEAALQRALDEIQVALVRFRSGQ